MSICGHSGSLFYEKCIWPDLRAKKNIFERLPILSNRLSNWRISENNFIIVCWNHGSILQRRNLNTYKSLKYKSNDSVGENERFLFQSKNTLSKVSKLITAIL